MARRPDKKPGPPHPPAPGQPAPPRPPDPRVEKAKLAWKQRRYDDAIRHYEQALARNPRDPVLLANMARAYALRFRYADAERLNALALSLYPDNARVLHNLGHSYLMIHQFDRAIDCLERSLKLDPAAADRPQNLIELAVMHERLHHLDAARRCAEEALALDPRLEKARYMLAVVDRRGGDVAAAAVRWRQLIEARQASPAVLADSWYQLAALADADGRYDEAFIALALAKQILIPAAGPMRYDAADISRVAGRTFAVINSDYCQRWHAAGAALQPLPGPLALITSHPRSGTTLLEQVLDSHPDAVSADELQVFSDLICLSLGKNAPPDASAPSVLDATSAEDLNALRRSYWSAMEGALRQPVADRLLVDKNPELTLLLPVIARVFPEMKIVFALRDPRDVVVSCYMQRLPLNPVSVHYLTLEGTAEKYAATMRAWLKIRDMLKNPWIEVRYEDAVADLEKQARRTLDFLGLPWDDVVLNFHRRAQQKHILSPTYEAVTKPVYATSIGRWRHYAAQLEPVQKILQPFVEVFGYS